MLEAEEGEKKATVDAAIAADATDAEKKESTQFTPRVLLETLLEYTLQRIWDLSCAYPKFDLDEKSAANQLCRVPRGKNDKVPMSTTWLIREVCKWSLDVSSTPNQRAAAKLAASGATGDVQDEEGEEDEEDEEDEEGEAAEEDEDMEDDPNAEEDLDPVDRADLQAQIAKLTLALKTAKISRRIKQRSLYAALLLIEEARQSDLTSVGLRVFLI